MYLSTRKGEPRGRKRIKEKNESSFRKGGVLKWVVLLLFS
jgi:hypothetical protein